jgi:hypothetical protein
MQWPAVKIDGNSFGSLALMETHHANVQLPLVLVLSQRSPATNVLQKPPFTSINVEHRGDRSVRSAASPD